jgi:hypothetical protein
MADVLGDNYGYTPYATVNEEQMLAFLNAYEDILAEGKEPPESFEVPEGKGAGGSDRLYRIQAGVTDMFIRDINNPAATAVSSADIPVMIAHPQPGAPGANVLYLEGHIDMVSWGQFPMTAPTVDKLMELDPPEYAEDDEDDEK